MLVSQGGCEAGGVQGQVPGLLGHHKRRGGGTLYLPRGGSGLLCLFRLSLLSAARRGGL